jgi:hypothetical protein
MWASYQALCELGATDIDPTSFFGVRPAELDIVHEQLQKPQTLPLKEKPILSPSLHFSQPERKAHPVAQSALFTTFSDGDSHEAIATHGFGNTLQYRIHPQDIAISNSSQAKGHS